jgi:hypothetical protein
MEPTLVTWMLVVFGAITTSTGVRWPWPIRLYDSVGSSSDKKVRCRFAQSTSSERSCRVRYTGSDRARGARDMRVIRHRYVFLNSSTPR